MKVLTSAQKELVEKNHSLIYSFLHRHNLPIDEFYDAAAIGLCNAAAKYDENSGYSFSTFAYAVIYNQIKLEFRKQNTMKHKFNSNTISLEADLTSYTEDLTVEGTCASHEAFENVVAEKDAILAKLNILSRNEIRVLLNILQGKSADQIASILHVSANSVRHYLHHARKKLSGEISGWDNTRHAFPERKLLEKAIMNF